MNFANMKSITIPEGKVKRILSGSTVLWKSGYTNQVRLSINTDGSIYNGGLGYKDGYRVRSGGAEAAYTPVTITGYIPYKKGDKLYIYPPFTGGNTENTVNFYDSTFANLGQVTDSGAMYGMCQVSGNPFKTQLVNGVTVLDISSVTVAGVENIAYVRIGNYIKTSSNMSTPSIIQSGSEMIITKNEELTV
ncbi:MAG: hypothetical protein J6R82_04975 [Clostridia bacterium]|nr:hypothetical protein [Clostridia bacterium]